MPLGNDEDFRMVGFGHVQRFGPQDRFGGPETAALERWTVPSGSSNVQSPVPPLTLPQLGSSTFSLPAINLPSFNIPSFNPMLPMTGTTTAATTFTVIDGAGPTTYTGIDTLEFTSAFTLTPVGLNQITVDYLGGGGGGGTTLYTGQITNAVQTAGLAKWSYTVDIYTTAGAYSTTVTAYNLLEIENTGTLAYGYAVTGGDRITGTSYYVRSVPLNTWVRMELTGAITGVSNYYFSAPNVLSGTC